MKNNICLFAGTTEGRILAERFAENMMTEDRRPEKERPEKEQPEGRLSGGGRSENERLEGGLRQEILPEYYLCVCVATEYGEVLLGESPHFEIHRGRMDRNDMVRFFRERNFSLILDATHPYAELVSANIKSAAEEAGIRRIRILRPEGEGDETLYGQAVFVPSAEEAAAYLKGQAGNILLSTGSKELPQFAGLERNRLYARVLPLADSLKACLESGIEPSHIYAMQGPFSEEMNLAHLHASGAVFLVTKQSGKSGGFEEKLAAAKKAGVTPVIIGRPVQGEGMDLSEAVLMVDALIHPFSEGEGDTAAAEQAVIETERPAVSIIGIGVGNPSLLTSEASEALKSCDCLIGAKRLTDALSEYGKPAINEIDPVQIRLRIEGHPDYRTFAAVMSGDVGFYSGAKKLKETLAGYPVRFLCGISSVVYFASRLQIPWEDIRLMSLHGRNANLAAAVRMNRRVMALTGGENRVSAVCRRLCEYGLGEVSVAVGERLSYENETVTCGKASEFTEKEFDSLSVILIENENSRNGILHGIPDEEFVRSEVPMTKSEVRSISLSKLALTARSVVCDIGAGTGSVSVEAALAAYEGSVYAVEKNPQGIRLIRENAVKFGADNLYAVEGTAPEALTDLPAPTHAFIGGSSGNMKEIVACLLDKNPEVCIVVNTVTLESLAEAMECIGEFGFGHYESVSVNVSRARKLGKYHLMTAQNPVFVIKMEKKDMS